MPPPGHSNHGWNEFAGDVAPHARSSGDDKENNHWGSSHGPVELYSGYHVNMEPVELSGQVQSMKTPKGAK